MCGGWLFVTELVTATLTAQTLTLALKIIFRQGDIMRINQAQTQA